MYLLLFLYFYRIIYFAILRNFGATIQSYYAIFMF